MTLSAPSGEHGDGRLRDRRRLGGRARRTTPPRRGTLTFTAGQTTKQIVVAVNGDTDDRDERDVHGQPVEPGERDDRRDRHGTGTITNDDALADADDRQRRRANEGNSGTTNFVFTVTLSAASGQHRDGRLRDRGRHGATRPATTPRPPAR